MPSRASRRKQSSKNRKKAMTKQANVALRASARQLDETLGIEEMSAPSSPPAESDLEKLQELAPDMSASVLEQVLLSSSSVEEAGEKLIHMSDPDATIVGPSSDQGGTGKIVIPMVDNEAEYPELSSTVESAYKVLTKGSHAYGTDEDNEDDDDDNGTEMDEFVVITDADVTDWLVVDSADYAVSQAPKQSYAHVTCA